jgi:hypothetical protein
VATAVVEELLVSSADGPPQIVDADAWESDPRIFRWIGELSAHRPDYFFYTKGAYPTLFVVEVKGTSTNRTTMVRQLARGVEQVGTIARLPGSTCGDSWWGPYSGAA